MKTAFFYMAVVSISLSGGALLHAQTPVAASSKEKAGQKKPGAHASQGIDNGALPLMDLLQLTPKQKEKVKAIWEAQNPKIKAIQEAERAKMKAVFDDVNRQIRPILTPEQRAVFDNAKKLRDSQEALRKNKAAAK